MAHDYSERMSLMLDGRLAAQERAELEAHLQVCDECRTRWVAFQQVDRVLSNAATFAPAPNFVNRFAARLAKQQVEQARRARRERTVAWVGVFATGLAAMALLIVPALLATWAGLVGFAEGAPTLFVSVVEELARWLVTLSALGEAGFSVLSTLTRSSGSILMGYTLMLVLVTTAWVSVMKNVSRRWNTATLPVLL